MASAVTGEFTYTKRYAVVLIIKRVHKELNINLALYVVFSFAFQTLLLFHWVPFTQQMF